LRRDTLYNAKPIGVAREMEGRRKGQARGKLAGRWPMGLEMA